MADKCIINGHEYVDLGLSVKWATCNVGASKPEEYGDYYAWGETKTKSSYDFDNCETIGEDFYDIDFQRLDDYLLEMREIWAIGDIKGTARDVAHVKWGGTWRMATDDEIEELIKNCYYEWTTLNGINGGRFKSRKNGKSIFLPAAGRWYGTSLGDAGSDGYYWNSTPCEIDDSCADHLYFYNGSRLTDWGDRSHGQTVRPVSE